MNVYTRLTILQVIFGAVFLMVVSLLAISAYAQDGQEYMVDDDPALPTPTPTPDPIVLLQRDIADLYDSLDAVTAEVSRINNTARTHTHEHEHALPSHDHEHSHSIELPPDLSRDLERLEERIEALPTPYPMWKERVYCGNWIGLEDVPGSGISIVMWAYEICEDYGRNTSSILVRHRIYP